MLTKENIFIRDSNLDSISIKKQECKNYDGLVFVHINKIVTVEELADLLGCSRAWVHRKIVESTGLSPTVLLRKLRFEALHDYIQLNLECSAYEAAIHVGLQNDKALCKFLTMHFGTNFTDLRQNIKNNVSISELCTEIFMRDFIQFGSMNYLIIEKNHFILVPNMYMYF